MKFQVNWQLELNGKTYQAGATIELDDKKDKATVEQLTTSGVISAPAKADEPDEAK